MRPTVPFGRKNWLSALSLLLLASLLLSASGGGATPTAVATEEATAELGLGGRPLDDRERGRVDARSAAIMLRRYLDARARGTSA